MTTRFVGGDVWPEFTTAARTRGPRWAAVAYIGADAPDLLPLEAGDVLVCDASDPVLLAHGTSPSALETYLTTGVQVWSCAGLHAKVLTTASRAVIGSANASAHSTELDEALVVTTDAAIRRAVREFITGLAATTEVNELFLEAAKATWAKGKRGPIGTSHKVRDPGAFVSGHHRMRLVHTDLYTPGAKETETFRRLARRVRRAAGPASTFVLESFRSEDGAAVRRGDVLVVVADEGEGMMVWPPVVVVSDGSQVGRNGAIFVTRGLAELTPIRLSDARSKLSARGVDARLGEERFVRSPEVRSALLDLWGLSSEVDNR